MQDVDVNVLESELAKLWRDIGSEKAAALIIAYERLRQARIDLKEKQS